MQTPSADAGLQQVGPSLALDPDVIRAHVDAVLSEEIYWFPVRHHSPAVARHLQAKLIERKPRIVFIEGPIDASELIPHIIDAKTRPPIAIYTSYRDDNNVLGLAGIVSAAADIPARFSSWYPMTAYSPEYVALMTARKIKADTVFMDLPHHALIKAAPKTEPPGAESGVQPQEVWETERLLAESGFYHMLAQAAGFRNWDEAWDTLFETRTFATAEEFRRELAVFCCAARATTSNQRVQNDDTLPRERHMLRVIRDTLTERKIPARDAFIVCGGFHLFMDRKDPIAPPEPPPGTVYSTLVPYSFFRISELSGYGAGNRAPQFYQRSWDLHGEDRPEQILVEHVIAVLKQTRRAGEVASSADAIAICQHARMLGRLRGRSHPVLDDIREAVITCVCKGNPAEEGIPLLAAMDQIEIGNAIGKVTAALGRLPIVEDFYQQIADLDLAEVTQKEKKVTLKLDKRIEKDQRRSAFFHRLGHLGVELAARANSAAKELATGKIFGETWHLKWTPHLEATLVEKNLYGATIETAVLSVLQEEIAKDELHAGRTCQRLVRAIDMDLPTVVAHVQEACGKAIDADPRFVSLCQALAAIGLLERYAVFRNLRQDQLQRLIGHAFDRACFTLPEAASVPDNQQMEVVAALKSVSEVIGRDDHLGLDRRLFVQQVHQAAHDSTVPFMRGAFLGLLTELRDLTAQDLAREVASLAQAPVEKMITAGDFLDGVLAMSGTSIMLGADALIQAIDGLLRAADWDPFLVMLPRLRSAFHRLNEHQIGSLASRVAGLYGIKEVESLTDLSTSVEVAAHIARIDQRVAAIMAKWDF